MKKLFKIFIVGACIGPALYGCGGGNGGSNGVSFTGIETVSVPRSEATNTNNPANAPIEAVHVVESASAADDPPPKMPAAQPAENPPSAISNTEPDDVEAIIRKIAPTVTFTYKIGDHHISDLADMVATLQKPENKEYRFYWFTSLDDPKRLPVFMSVSKFKSYTLQSRLAPTAQAEESKLNFEGYLQTGLFALDNRQIFSLFTRPEPFSTRYILKYFKFPANFGITASEVLDLLKPLGQQGFCHFALEGMVAEWPLVGSCDFRVVPFIVDKEEKIKKLNEYGADGSYPVFTMPIENEAHQILTRNANLNSRIYYYKKSVSMKTEMTNVERAEAIYKQANFEGAKGASLYDIQDSGKDLEVVLVFRVSKFCLQDFC